MAMNNYRRTPEPKTQGFTYNVLVFLFLVNLFGVVGQFVVDLYFDGELDTINYGSVMLMMLFAILLFYMIVKVRSRYWVGG